MDNTTLPPDAPAIPDPQPLRYVTYGADGTLDGCYLQVPPEAHAACMIVVDEVIAADWPHYRANDARDGIELAPLAPPAPAAIPQQVTMRQARLALLAADRLSDVDPAIDSLDSPAKEQARIEWDYSSTVERGRALVAMLGQKLGLDDAALDQLFIAAAGL